MTNDVYSVDFEGNVHGSAIFCPHCFRKQRRLVGIPSWGTLRCDTCGGLYKVERTITTVYTTRKERTNG